MKNKLRLGAFLLLLVGITYFSTTSSSAQHKDTIFTGATMTYKPLTIDGIIFPDCYGPATNCLMAIVEHECGCSGDGN